MHLATKFPLYLQCAALLLMTVCLSACTPPVKPESVAAVKVGPKAKAKPVIVKKPVKVERSVAILLSNDSAAFKGLGLQLQESLGQRAELFSLKGDATLGAQMRKRLQQSKHQQLVAVGLLAAQVASTLKDKQVIFCKVFNYRDNDLLRPWMKGVSMMPPADKVFAAWKGINPQLHEVAVITGLNQTEYISRVRLAARKHNISILHRVVRNNNEFSFASKSLETGAQWLVPDNRVLSRTTLLDVMSHSVKEGRQIFAFDPALLKFGALASVQAIDGDIAKQVLAKLRFSTGKAAVFGKNVAPVHKLDLKISAKALDRLGLAVPEKYQTAIQ